MQFGVGDLSKHAPLAQLVEQTAHNRPVLGSIPRGGTNYKGGAALARPLKEIDKNEFEKLCGLQCTKEEICAFFDLTDKTLENWCKRTYKAGFSEVFRQKRGLGKISLRRAQFKLAKKNASMAIFLGKQYLGQRDQPDTDVGRKNENNLLDAIQNTEEIDVNDLPEVE